MPWILIWVASQKCSELKRRNGCRRVHQEADVVGEIGHADLHRRSGDADGSDEQAHPGFLVSEGVLDMRSDLRSPAIGTRRRLAHRPPLWLLVVDVAGKAVPVEPGLVLLRPIGRVVILPANKGLRK